MTLEMFFIVLMHHGGENILLFYVHLT